MSPPREVPTEAVRSEADERRLDVLAEASTLLAISLDHIAVLRRLASLVVPALGDWCYVDLIEGEHHRRIAVATSDRDRTAIARALERYDPKPSHPALQAFREGRSVEMPEVTEELLQLAAHNDEHLTIIRGAGMRCAVSAPMLARGDVVGVLTLAMADSGRTFTREQISTIEDIARRAGLAVENSRLFTSVQQAEARYRALVQNVDAVVWEAEIEPFRFTFVSDRAESLFGYPIERWLEDPSFWSKIVHPEDARTVMARWRSDVEARLDHRATYRVVTADGRVRWIEHTVTLQQTSGSAAPAIARGLMSDVTQRIRREMYERAQHAADRVFAEADSVTDVPAQLLRALCETIGWDAATLWNIDEDNDVLHCSELYVGERLTLPEYTAACRAFSFERGRGLPGRVWASRAPEWIEDVLVQTNMPRSPAMLRDGLRAVLAFPVLAGGRFLGVIEFASRTVTPPDDELMALMATIGAQTGQFFERKRIEQALRESEARTRAILEAAQDAVVSMDHEGAIVEFNPAAERMFGYARDAVLGRPIADVLVPPSLREAHVRGIARYMRTRKSRVMGQRLELPAVRADGSEFPVEITISLVDVPGPPLFTAFIRDLTEQAAAGRLRDAQHETMRALTEARTIDDATERVLEAIGRSLGCAVGMAWIVDERAGALRFASAWVAPGTDAEELLALSSVSSFGRGEGLPGRVWSVAEPTWVNDPTEDELVPRAEAIGAAGLSGGFAFPVVDGDGVVAVMELFTATARDPDQSVLRVLGAIGSQVGQFVQRKRAEEQIRFHRALLESQNEATVDGIVVTTSTGSILSYNRRFAELFDVPDEIIEQSDDDVLAKWALGRFKDPDAFLRHAVELHRQPDQQDRVEVELVDGRVLDTYSAPLVGEHGERFGRAWYYRDITEQKRTEAALAESRERFAFLAEASTVLAASLDEQQTVDTLVRLVVPYLADACTVDTVTDDGSIHQAARVNASSNPLVDTAPRAHETNPAPPHGALRVIMTGRSEMAAEIPDEWLVETARGDEAYLETMRSLGVKSYMCVPLTARGRTIGALTLVTIDSGRRYSAADVALAEDLARRAALAIDNARLYSDREHVARTLQDSLLPPTLPTIAGVEVGAAYHFAGQGTEVGGDFYDLFETGDDEWAVAVGDVCGKGADAAALTALARYTLRAGAMQARKPSRVLAMLNEAIIRQHTEGRFCTVAYVRLGARESGVRKATIGCGGHPFPLLLRADDSVEQVGNQGTLIGLFADATVTDVSITMEPGDALVLYTDGVIEARHAGGVLGEDGLRDIVEGCRGLDAPAIANRVGRAAVDVQGGEPRDDIAVVVLRIASGENDSPKSGQLKMGPETD